MDFAVIGLGRFGLSLAYELQELGCNVVGIDINKTNCTKAGEILDNVVMLDATDSKALLEIEINNFDKVIVGIGQDAMEASFLTCLNLQECGVSNFIAKAATRQHKKILTKMGVEHIIMPEEDMGKRLAHRISKSFHYDYFEFDEDIRADKISVTKQMHCIIDKNISTINLRKRFNVNIIGIKRHGSIIIPDGNTVINVGDQLLVFGSSKHLENFEKKLLKDNHGLFNNN